MSSDIEPDSERLLAVQNSPEFAELRRAFRRFAFPMTVVFLGWYLLYVLASGYARDFMGHELLGQHQRRLRVRAAAVRLDVPHRLAL